MFVRTHCAPLLIDSVGKCNTALIHVWRMRSAFGSRQSGVQPTIATATKTSLAFGRRWFSLALNCWARPDAMPCELKCPVQGNSGKPWAFSTCNVLLPIVLIVTVGISYIVAVVLWWYYHHCIAHIKSINSCGYFGCECVCLRTFSRVASLKYSRINW